MEIKKKSKDNERVKNEDDSELKEETKGTKKLIILVLRKYLILENQHNLFRIVFIYFEVMIIAEVHEWRM